MNKYISNKIFQMKRIKIIRIIVYPIINIQRFWRKNTFYLSKQGKYITSLKNKYKGKRCFIIGNGPSLCIEDLELLQNEICFASNRIFSIFEKTTWRPQFYFALDAEIIRENIKSIKTLKLDHIFLDILAKKYRLTNRNLHYFFNYSPFVIRIPSLSNITFSDDLAKYVGMGYTVTYACLQFALYMGFKDIYLLGMDHNYSNVIDKNGMIQTKEGVMDHFLGEKNDPRVFQFLEGVNYAYKLADKKARKKKAYIINVTRGGKLEIFQRKKLESLFSS